MAVTVLVVLALLPLCGTTPLSMGSLGQFGYGGGARPPATNMDLSRAMVGMAAAARMMSMASQAVKAAQRTPLDVAGRLGPHAAWNPLSMVPPQQGHPGALMDMMPHQLGGPGGMMDMLPPPPPGAAQLGRRLGGKFAGEFSSTGQRYLAEKAAAKQPVPMSGPLGMVDALPPGGSSQLHIMEKLHGEPKGTTPSGQTLAPVGVGADFTFFASKLAPAGDTLNSPDSLDPYSGPVSAIAHAQPGSNGPGSQPAQDLQFHDASQGQETSSHKPGSPAAMNGRNPSKMGLGQQKQEANLYTPSPPHHISPPPADQLLMSNLFITGSEKNADNKQPVFAEPTAPSSKNGGLGPIPGLTVPLHDGLGSAGNAKERALRAPCDLFVDAVFALDDMKNLWLAQEAIRYYETQLLPSKKTRFAVVLCGHRKTFYTALHQHFSALLASLEDLQHANATLEPAQQMPDTPGHRSDNNPYPPRVSEDFAQIDAGCLETAYHLLTYQSPPNVNRLLTVVGTKERWADRLRVEEARFLHSLNISLLTTAAAHLSPEARDTLRKMASTPDKFRAVSDNVTLRALPAMIGSAICKPQKADVTGAVQRTATGVIQEPVVKECILEGPTLMRRTTDFGAFFGTHIDRVSCTYGLVPDLRLCACV